MTELRRTLGLPALTLYGLGTILGAGIYSVVGAAAGRAGAALWLSFLVSTVVAGLTALSYAELATAFPRAGAEYVYLRHAIPKRHWPAFVAATMMAASSAATAATVSLAFAGYLERFVDLPRMAVALALIAVLLGVSLIGVRESVSMNTLFTLIEAAGLVLVIVIGATVEDFGTALVTPPGAGVIGGAALVFFSFLGFENIANLAEEAKNPERDLPRAILASLLIASALYVLVALAVLALLPLEELTRSNAPLAAAVAAKSPRVAGVLNGIALFATANTALASVLSGSRLLYGIARGGDLPSAAARVLPGRRTPWVATLAVVAFSLLLMPFGEVGVVAGISSFAALVAFGSVNFALIVLRLRAPELPRPFRVPLSIGRVPVLPSLGLASVLVLITQVGVKALAAGAGSLLALLLLHAAISRVRGGRDLEDREANGAPSSGASRA
jgi:amino acid transporter